MKKLSSESGFSLIETLVAITILLIVIVGPMAISARSAKSTTFSSEQVTAFFLAQEGVELITMARDNLQLTNLGDTGWTSFTRTASGGVYRNCYSVVSAQGCGVSLNASGLLPAPINCTTGSCLLYFNNTTVIQRSRFTHTPTGAVASKYTRKVILSNVNANEVSVISRVTWRSGSLRDEQMIEVRSSLFNVYGN